MTCDLAALCFDARDPRRLAAFWAGVLGWQATDDRQDGGVALVPSDDTGFAIRFLPSQEEKAGPNRVHFDLLQQHNARRRRRRGPRFFGQPDEHRAP